MVISRHTAESDTLLLYCISKGEVCFFILRDREVYIKIKAGTSGYLFI
jgi:hypothetical protein